jgi:hypothetical protein
VFYLSLVPVDFTHGYRYLATSWHQNYLNKL